MGSIGRDTRSIRGMIPGSCKPAHVTHVELVGLSTRLLDTVEDELNPNGHTLRVECGRDEPRAVAADQPPLARSDGGGGGSTNSLLRMTLKSNKLHL